jgi:hypothetical protein
MYIPNDSGRPLYCRSLNLDGSYTYRLLETHEEYTERLDRLMYGSKQNEPDSIERFCLICNFRKCNCSSADIQKYIDEGV